MISTLLIILYGIVVLIGASLSTFLCFADDDNPEKEALMDQWNLLDSKCGLPFIIGLTCFLWIPIGIVAVPLYYLGGFLIETFISEK